jgi:hypothetical protein
LKAITTERTAKQLHAICRKYVKKWKSILFLGMWEIVINVENVIESNDHTGSGGSVSADCNTDWRYLTAHIRFSFNEMSCLPEKKLEEIVIHEMMHIVVNEMRDRGYKHEERVVSHLALAFAKFDHPAPTPVPDSFKKEPPE